MRKSTKKKLYVSNALAIYYKAFHQITSINLRSDQTEDLKPPENPQN